MALRLILALAALGGLWFAWTWLKRQPPVRRKKTLILGGFALVAALGLALLLTGKMAGLFAVIAGLSPWIGRAMQLHRLWQGLRGLGSAPRASGPPPPTAAETAMTRAQAHEVLGLSPGASAEQIREAHRRLMRANHPDAGGSTWIAARLNQARDLLLDGDA